LHIRTATPNDIPALARIQVEGWRGAYAGIVPQDFLDALDPAVKETDWRRWFAETHMTVLIGGEDGDEGFCCYGQLRTPIPGMSPFRPAYGAEIYSLYVLPSAWRKGLGTALVREAARRLSAERQQGLCLWVVEKNKRAVSFYKKLGGQRCANREIEIAGVTLKELCYGWRDIRGLCAG
jgi:ribosomal protein S18 acetylase RimI-like enzyme